MKLSSPAFTHNGNIPKIYTCQGKNINPPLEISEIPSGTESLALIMDDPDVPATIRKERMYDHWIVYDLDPSTTTISENVQSLATEGLNTGGKIGYTGPCPPDREHRYFFKLYALDKKLKLKPGLTKDALLKAMEGHIITHTELIGRYEKL